MDQAIVSILERRRNKAIAIVLGVKEREIDHLLPKHLQDKMRKVVLDQFNDLHEVFLDVMRSVDDAGGDKVYLNEEYLDMIRTIHKSVTHQALSEEDLASWDE